MPRRGVPPVDADAYRLASQRVMTTLPDRLMATHFPLPADGNGPVDVDSCRIVKNSGHALLDVVFVRDGGAHNVHAAYNP
jgi:hypothetical protein